MTDGTESTADDRSSPGPVTLARAYAWSELRGQGWKLFAFPLALGTLFALGTLLAAATSISFDPETTRLLQEGAAQFFVDPPGEDDLVLAFVVVQGPSVVAMLAALTSLLLVQTGLGKRLAGGEFELLLSGPYRERDVFVALVFGSFALVAIGLVALTVLAMGPALALLLSANVQLNAAGVTLLVVGVIAAVPMALWATFVTVVVYLLYPEAATNNSHPGNLLAMLGILPALSLLLALTTGIGVDPLVAVAAANLVPLAAIAIGWVTVRWWFSVEKVL